MDRVADNEEEQLMSYPPTLLVSANAQLRQNSFLSQVYAWMTAGLLVTSAVATYAASTPIVLNLIYGNLFTIWLLFIAQIGLGHPADQAPDSAGAGRCHCTTSGNH